MKVLVIGSGGREHALAWKLAASPRVAAVLVAPGNAGTAREARVRNVDNDGAEALADLAEREGVAFTVVGPEAPLAAGVVDAFRARGLRIFGPTRAAARLESSKSFAKAFMARHAIPTAEARTFDDAPAAHAHVDAEALPIVVKADGLAAGKGVVVAATREEAHAAIDAMLGAASGLPAGAGGRVVVERFLEGEEASFIVVCAHGKALALATSQDHKRLGDGDVGPNTGGMGAYSPAPVVTPNVHARVMHEIVQPTLAGMAAEGTPFDGFLYVGLMVDADGAPRVVEYNARLGDPEAEPLLMRLKSDLFELLMRATDARSGAIDEIELQWDRRVALGVVMAAPGYPSAPERGAAIDLDALAARDDVKVFHAGTSLAGESFVATGGRVLCVTALGESVRQARQHAYAAIDAIAFPGAQFRRDIGERALRR